MSFAMAGGGCVLQELPSVASTEGGSESALEKAAEELHSDIFPGGGGCTTERRLRIRQRRQRLELGRGRADELMLLTTMSPVLNLGAVALDERCHV